ncbi:MAG: hypothetical protein IT368_12115 [Candidatus Hydrogenedentes bacterium]|nr:hypothetical protein [Candidatus Hydrogenedentota bacterium]
MTITLFSSNKDMNPFLNVGIHYRLAAWRNKKGGEVYFESGCEICRFCRGLGACRGVRSKADMLWQMNALALASGDGLRRGLKSGSYRSRTPKRCAQEMSAQGICLDSRCRSNPNIVIPDAERLWSAAAKAAAFNQFDTRPITQKQDELLETRDIP